MPIKTLRRKVTHTLFHGKPEKWVIKKYIHGLTLNVGAGRDRIPGTKTVDNLQHQQYTDWDVKPDYVCDATELHKEFKPETVDCILAMHLYEHLRRPDDFLDSAHFVLKSGGYLCLLCPNYEYMGSVAYFRDPTHIHGLIPGVLWAQLRLDKRFRIVQFNTLGFLYPMTFDLVLQKV